MSRRLALVALAAACASPTTVAAPALEEGAGAATSSPTAPVTRVAPRVSPSVASRSRPFTGLTASAPGRLSSTAYCETGLMANGQRTRRYVAAGNRWPLGTVLHVSDSPYGPGDFTVLDRIGHGSDLDFAMPGDCAGARAWGRRTVTVEVVS